MRAYLIYPEQRLGDPEANLQAIEAKLKAVRRDKPELVLFPPGFLLGVGLGFDSFRPEFTSFFYQEALPRLAKISRKSPPFLLAQPELRDRETLFYFAEGHYEKWQAPGIASIAAEALASATEYLPLIFSWLPSYLDGPRQLTRLGRYLTGDERPCLVLSPAAENSSSDGAFLGEFQYAGVPQRAQGIHELELPIASLEQLACFTLNRTEDLAARQNLDPARPLMPELSSDLSRALEIPAAGLAQRLQHLGQTKLILGLSGGMDSTLALVYARRALMANAQALSDLKLYYLPGFGSSEKSLGNARALATALDLSLEIIDIRPACEQHFRDIGQPLDRHDITFENAQARERTQILMDLANQKGGIVLGTGTLSEAALGWCTFNGDQISMYHVNGGVPKTLVPELLKLEAETLRENLGPFATALEAVAATPASPELLPAKSGKSVQVDDPLAARTEQITEDVLGPYALYDYFLWQFRAKWQTAPQIFAALEASGLFPELSREQQITYLKRFVWRYYGHVFKRRSSADWPSLYAEDLLGVRSERLPSDFNPSFLLRELEG